MCCLQKNKTMYDSIFVIHESRYLIQARLRKETSMLTCNAPGANYSLMFCLRYHAALVFVKPNFPGAGISDKRSVWIKEGGAANGGPCTFYGK